MMEGRTLAVPRFAFYDNEPQRKKQVAASRHLFFLGSLANEISCEAGCRSAIARIRELMIQ